MNADNNSEGRNGRNSSVNGNDGSSRSAAESAERRKRISISDYKQRKKPEDVASTPINNNDIHFKIEPDITIDMPLATPETLPTTPQPNGQATALDNYYIQMYLQQKHLASEGKALPPASFQQHYTYLSTMSSSLPGAPPLPSYPHFKPPSPPNINSTQSRLHRVEDWTSTTPRRPSQASSHPQRALTTPNNSFPHEKTPKMTPASALNDPKEATSYREWKKRKYGTEDPPNLTPENPSKYPRTNSWRGRGDPRGKSNSRGRGEANWDDKSSAPVSGGLDSWDDAPAPAAAQDTWDDAPAPVPAKNLGLESWDDTPAPVPAKNPSLESWDDAPAPPAAAAVRQGRQKSTEDNWDDDEPPPAASKDVMKSLDSWDDPPAVPKLDEDPPKSYGTWEPNSAPPPRAKGPSGDSWDDDTSSAPPQPSQAALNSWDEPPAPPPAAPVPTDDWDTTPVKVGGDDNAWSTGESSQNNRNNYRQSRDNFRGRGSGSRDNSGSRGFRRDYRAGSKSSDHSESGYSGYQNRGTRGNRGNRSGSRDSGDWGRNGSRDRSEGRGGWNSRNYGDRKNGNNYQDRRNSGNGYQDRRNSYGDRNNGFNKNNNDSWGQSAPSPAPVAALESWDDDPAPPQPSKQVESWGTSTGTQGNQSWNNSHGRNNYSNAPANPVVVQELESWDDEEAPPQASAVVSDDWGAGDAAGGPSGAVGDAGACPVGASGAVQTAEASVQANESKQSHMIKSLCTTCSYQLVHRCKFTKDPESFNDLKPGELHTCPCSLVFLHEKDCLNKIGEPYAPVNSETSLIKQVSRSLQYKCQKCEFLITIENIKEPVHFFRQLTTKKGDKLRGNSAINDPEGFEVLVHHIQEINDAECLGRDEGSKDNALKDKMSSIAQCNKGCCTVYHDCDNYQGIGEDN